jgi:hypothetical protein
MNQSVSIGKALTHIFDDPKWLNKSIVGSLIAMVPILNFALIGYELQIVRAVSKGASPTLPEWDDISKLFIDGLKLGLARLVYALPILVLLFGALIFQFIVIFIAAALSKGNTNGREEAFALVPLLIVLGYLAAFAIAALYGLIVGVIMPAMTANYVRRGVIAACFNLGEMFVLIKQNVNAYLMVWATNIIAGIVYIAISGLANSIPCLNLILILPVTAFGLLWTLTVSGHALGQFLSLDTAHAA